MGLLDRYITKIQKIIFFVLKRDWDKLVKLNGTYI